MWAAAVLLLAAVVALIVVFKYTPATTAESVQYAVAKLILFSVLFSAVFWSARNYKAHKHNETVNRHRENALATFRAFVEGSADTRVKDAILLQAAQAAFTGRPTGFDAPHTEAATIPNPVIEILGRVVPKEAQEQ
jgi:hypothetical protein